MESFPTQSKFFNVLLRYRSCSADEGCRKSLDHAVENVSFSYQAPFTTMLLLKTICDKLTEAAEAEAMEKSRGSGQTSAVNVNK